MRKLIFAFAIVLMGAFGFAAGTPASAMTAGPVAGMTDVVKPAGTAEAVHWRRHWHRHYYRHHYWGWHHRRHCWWRHGYRYCRWGRW